MLPFNKRRLKIGQEFQWPTKCIASKIDTAVREHMQKERILCRPRRFKLITSIHMASIAEGRKRRQVGLGLGIVVCEPVKVHDALFAYEGLWYFGEEAIKEVGWARDGMQTAVLT